MIYIDEPEPNLLVSKMKHFGDDTRPADVVTFDPQKHTDRTHKLQQYITTLKERDTHRLLEFFNSALTKDVFPQPEGAAIINKLAIIIKTIHDYFGT